MKKAWIGIIGSLQRFNEFENKCWWCLPKSAEKGDNILFYCPRSVSLSKQGIFALCSLKEFPSTSHDKNFYCSGFGIRGQKGSLYYAALKFEKRYKIHLPAIEIKKDPFLAKLPFVRRNFQGTVFSLELEPFKRIISLLEEKN
jgi:hypothetical protein